MDLFGSDIFSHPKGMIWYGPPGTGKSAISHRLCVKSGMVFVTQPLAAGDVKKGIVGDTELTINAIADRARLIPWDTAVILIDEIDSLVPSRDD
jgi:SpoVK/Ycf46/Vps4 family AAA+-type ATPase